MRWAPLAVVAVAAVSSCGDDEDRRERPGGGNAEPARRASVLVERVVARGARVTLGRQEVRLLAIPRTGRLHVSCNRAGRSSATLHADHLLPSSDVIVETAGEAEYGRLDPDERFVPRADPFAAGIQRWQIAGFGKAQVPIATISVAARPLDPDIEGAACAISAQAIVFQSTAGTVTR
jgi:hypothetical protein